MEPEKKLSDNEKAATFIGWYAGLPIPDMSKPENYMRALEAVANGFSSYTIDVAFGCCAEGWFVALGDDYGNGPWIDGAKRNIEREAPTIGEATVLALVALYDAEHKP